MAETVTLEELPPLLTEHWRGPDYVDGWNAAVQAADDLAIRPRTIPVEPDPVIECDWDGCDKNVMNAALFRVNPKGESGVWACAEHARQINSWEFREADEHEFSQGPDRDACRECGRPVESHEPTTSDDASLVHGHRQDETCGRCLS